MSIIERAAGRLKSQGQAHQTAAPPTSTIAPPLNETAAVTANRETVITPPAATVAPARKVPDTPAPAPAEEPAPAPVTTVANTSTPETPAADSGATRQAPYQRRIDIDLVRLASMGFLTPGGRSLISEQFRMIKRPLIKQAFAPREPGGNPGNLIMITSALPKEGKTFCSINLALSIAMELDHTVLLVDVDVARPSVLRTLDVNMDAIVERGLMDLLLDDKLDMSDVLLKTNVDAFSVLPVGLNHSHSTELLASQTMGHLLEEIATRYPDRIVIFDSPPLLLTSEATVLAGKMGQIVVVVGGEKTTQQVIKSSLDQLKGCKNVSLIYNKSMAFSGTRGYGYTYDI